MTISETNKWDEIFGEKADEEYRKEFIHASNAIQKEIAEEFMQLLNFDKVSMDDNFLDLGGHSLLAIQLVVWINENFDLSIALDDILSQRFTVESLAGIVENELIKEIDSDKFEELVDTVKDLSESEAEKKLNSVSK